MKRANLGLVISVSNDLEFFDTEINVTKFGEKEGSILVVDMAGRKVCLQFQYNRSAIKSIHIYSQRHQIHKSRMTCMNEIKKTSPTMVITGSK